MNSRWIALFALLAISIVGLIRLALKHRGIKNRRVFVKEYQDEFARFAASDPFDGVTYEWLVRHSVEVQAELGPLGIAARFQPPGGQYIFHNYELIVNLLPEVRRRKLSGLGSRRVYHDLVLAYGETLIRYLGVLDKRINDSMSGFHNPFIWLREGTQFILLLPILMLHWFGVISASPDRSLEQKPLFRVIIGIATLVAFLGNLVEIVAGWDKFYALLVLLWDRSF